MIDEAARFRGYKDSEWRSEPAVCKARVLAHFLEHNVREAHAAEKAERGSKKGKQGPQTDFTRFRQGKAES